jgi:hypothetical protein
MLKTKTPNPVNNKNFTYKNGRTEISGTYGMKWLLFLCTLHSLRGYLLLLICGGIGTAFWREFLARIFSG